MNYTKLLQARKGNIPTQYLSAKQKAQQMGVHVNTIYNKCASGELPHMRVGWALLFLKSF